MLSLGRKINETIVITDTLTGAELRVTVVDLQRGKVQLGIKAPRRFVVDRLEVHEEKQRDSEQKRLDRIAANGGAS